MWKTVLQTTLGIVILIGVFVLGENLDFSREVSYTFPRKSSLTKTLAAVAHALPFTDSEKLPGEAGERINILILGVGGEGHDAPWLTDSIVLVSLVPASPDKTLLIGIPRDLMVEIPGVRQATKINALYLLGNRKPDSMRQAVSRVTGLEINSVVVFELPVVKSVVDALSGIYLYVPKDIDDPSYPTPTRGTEHFKIERGWRYLDGKLAEKYIRTRTGLEGDFGRMHRQIQVVEAIRARAAGLSILWDFSKMIKIYSGVSRYVHTDLAVGQIKHLWEMSKDINIDDVEYLALDISQPPRINPRKPLLTGGIILLGSSPASVLWPRAGIFEYSEIHERIERELTANK